MCEQTHLLAGKLAEHWGDVAGVLRHLLLDGLLHSRWDAARHARHDVLKLQERQGGVAHGFHQPLHPLFQLQPQNASFLKHCQSLQRFKQTHAWEFFFTLTLKKGSGRQKPFMMCTRWSSVLWKTLWSFSPLRATAWMEGKAPVCSSAWGGG